MKVDKNSRIERTIGALLALTMVLFGQSSISAQETKQIEEPREVRLETTDGVALTARYYPGTREKESVPVILLHRWEENHEKMVTMAGTLQSQFGYAVIVPDLRGHGNSSHTANGDELKPDRWRAQEIGAAIEDIEACKNFLIKENNEGNLNIDMLSVVADGESTILASIWTLRDWSYAPLGSLKQGQDVKALILLNPVRNFKGISGTDAYRNDLFTGRSGAAFPVIIASERDNARQARNIYEGMYRGRKSLESEDKHIEMLRFQIEEQKRVVKSRKDGTRRLDAIIGQFIEKEVFDRQHDFRWAERGRK